jgi:hypothetical protein
VEDDAEEEGAADAAGGAGAGGASGPPAGASIRAVCSAEGERVPLPLAVRVARARPPPLHEWLGAVASGVSSALGSGAARGAAELAAA